MEFLACVADNVFELHHTFRSTILLRNHANRRGEDLVASHYTTIFVEVNPSSETDELDFVFIFVRSEKNLEFFQTFGNWKSQNAKQFRPEKVFHFPVNVIKTKSK